MDEIDITFNRGRVPIATWNSSVHLRNSSGNSGFAFFCPKLVRSKGWKYLIDKSKNGHSQIYWKGPSLPFSPLVSIFTDGDSENAEWGHGSFPLDEYVKVLHRSDEEIYYNHSFGMSYSKIQSREERDLEMEDELTGELENADAYSDYDLEVTKEGEAIHEYLALLSSAENAA
ncbi:hypothetical protein OROMI_011557 [Orobanche minor]